MHNQNGLGLVEVLIALGIMGVVMMSVVSMQSMQANENRALTEKLAALDFSRAITSHLSVPNSCSLIITRAGNLASGNLTFNPASATYPFLLEFRALPETATTDLVSIAKPAPSPLSPALRIKPTGGIQVQVTGPTTGRILVNFDQNNLIRPVRDLNFPVSFSVTTSGANQTITGCTGNTLGGAGPGSTPGSACGQGIVMFTPGGKRACCQLINDDPWQLANMTMSCAAF